MIPQTIEFPSGKLHLKVCLSKPAGPGPFPAALFDHGSGVSMLTTPPGIDAHRIALVAHSFGGQLTPLAAERDPTTRAAVNFAGAAGFWERSPELRESLVGAMRRVHAAIMLTHAENDYSTAAGQALVG
jgi:dienelactone hydrolase